MLTIVDAIIILFIITGGVIGFKAGVIKLSSYGGSKIIISNFISCLLNCCKAFKKSLFIK